jgi:hypothetical protein
MRKFVMDAVGGLVDFGVVTATAVTDRIRQVTVTVLGIEDEAGAEQRSGQILYGNAAVLLRPKAADDDGACEVVYVRTGDEMVPIAHRETRWQIALEEGEVAIRAFGEDAARVTLKPDGTIVLGAGGDKVALASEVDARFADLAKALGSAVGSTDGGATYRLNILSALGTSGWTPAPAPTEAPSVGSEKVETE